MSDETGRDERIDEDLPELGSDELPTDLLDDSARNRIYRLRGAPEATAFAVGEMLAGRYKIVRFVARGGMGEVYEVEDTALRQRVALKTIRAEVALREDSLERFKREINLSRRITHWNVCRIFDLGFHRFPLPTSGGGREVEIMFLTMELIEGETLSRRVEEVGRLGTDEALPIVEQMAAGLDAAHGVGVLHRDFKSANVMLGESRDKRVRERVVITDFGLARTLGDDSSMVGLTQSSHVAGTPFYMAPEQVEGRDLTEAADIYALGIVMYEMVTGARPFDGGSPLSVAARKLNEQPPPPQEIVPDLDPRWNAAIVRCLEIDPAARPKSAVAVLDILHGNEPDSTALTVSTPRKRSPSTPEKLPAPAPRSPFWRRPLAVALLAVAIIGGGLTATVMRYWRPGSPAAGDPSKVEPRRALAVLDFKNVSGDVDAAWLSTAISEILTTELGVGNEVRTVRGQDVARLKNDLGLHEIVDPDAELLDRIRSLLAVDLAVSGSYTRVGEEKDGLIRVDLRLLETATGRLVAESGSTGTERQLFAVVERSSAEFREVLGMGRLSPAEALQVEAVMPADPIAAKLFAQGLLKARDYDYTAAKGLLEQAVDIEPDHPLPRAELARALSALGYGRAAEEQANKAAELAVSLPRSLRLSIEARAAAIAGLHDRAMSTYAHLFELYPDDVEIGLELARSQAIAGRPNESLVTLESLRNLPPPTGDDPRIDLRAASARRYLGELDPALENARDGIRKAEAAGLTHVSAQAKQIAGELLHTLGDPAQAMSMLEDSRELYASVNDLTGVAECLQGMALVLEDRGDLEGATRILESVLETNRQTGNEIGAARALHSLGNVAITRGSLDEATALFEQALVTFQANHAADEIAASLNGLGVALHLGGDLDGALKKYLEALEAYEDIGDKPSTALILTNIAEISYLHGDLAAAKQMHEDALAINREVGDTLGVAYDTYRLGMVFFEQGDLLVARGRYKEALELQNGLEDRLGSALTEVMLARVDLVEGADGSAAERAGSAAQILGADGDMDGETLAQSVLAEALIAAGNRDQAAPLVAQLREHSANVSEPGLRTAVVAAYGRFAVLTGDPADLASARAELSALIANLTADNLVPTRFEATLALAEVEMATGDRPAAESRLRDLAAEARAKGFDRIAGRAVQITEK